MSPLSKSSMGGNFFCSLGTTRKFRADVTKVPMLFPSARVLGHSDHRTSICQRERNGGYACPPSPSPSPSPLRQVVLTDGKERQDVSSENDTFKGYESYELRS